MAFKELFKRTNIGKCMYDHWPGLQWNKERPSEVGRSPKLQVPQSCFWHILPGNLFRFKKVQKCSMCYI